MSTREMLDGGSLLT